MTTNEENPYRAPQASILPKLTPPTAPQGAWRDGPYLVVHKSFRDYPGRCIACNAPHAAKARISVRWVRAPIALLVVALLLNPMLALIIWSVLPTATVWPSICKEHESRENHDRSVPWKLALLSLLALALAVVAIVFRNKLGVPVVTTGIAAMLAMLCFFFMLIAVAYAVFRPRLLSAFKIDRQFVWLDKVSQEYLQHFPELGAP